MIRAHPASKTSIAGDRGTFDISAASQGYLQRNCGDFAAAKPHEIAVQGSHRVACTQVRPFV